MTKHYKYLIIGSGPTGLGAAYRLKELGIEDFHVLESENYIGGLATSFVDDKGFTWDIGGHVQFSHYQYFDQLMIEALGEDGWLTHQRESWVWMKNRFVPYPFQNNIRYLPEENMWNCLKGIIEIYQNSGNVKPANFKEWILATFGNGIAEEFMLPYNFKVWAYPPEQMAYNWIGERVAVTDLKRVTENILFKKDDLSWGPNNTFQFPKYGGTGSIWKSAGEKLIGLSYFSLNTRVIEIDETKKTVKTHKGEVYSYDKLISTMPIDLLFQILKDPPEKLKTAASCLKHSKTNIVGIGLKGKPNPQLATKCWMYFPESNSPYYRVTLFSNYSPNNVPDINQYWSLMAETSESEAKPVNHETLIKDTIKALREDGLIQDRDEVVSEFLTSFEYGYPTPSVDRDELLKPLHPWLEPQDIYSRGRFGAWKYEVSNQDHSLMQGVELINRLELKIPETTLNFPGTANAMWGK
ncbi:MAG: FAD-dependent oxidoreductase [Flavobacteriales bacterium]|nr:FAD-dependent oxidoreductase [Flavobacteriales bacterium]